MRVYVASSWSNEHEPDVTAALRADGHDVTRGGDFSWGLTEPAWVGQPWTPGEYLRALRHHEARMFFAQQMDAVASADLCVLVMPCGPSASLTIGYAIGAGKPTVVYVPAVQRPDVMVKMATVVTDRLDLVLDVARSHAAALASDRRRFWLSWVSPRGLDYRPVTDPPNAAVLGWWCTGWSETGDIMCALVSATSEDEARAVIGLSWPETARGPIRWHFVEERPSSWLPDPVRFRPVHPWMRVRMGVAA